MRSRTDYILGSDSRLFQNVAVWDTRHNTHHYLVLGCLHRSGLTAHSHYLGKRTRFSIRPPAPLDKVDRMFSKLRGAIPKTPRRERHRQAWISPDTWSLIGTRTAACRQGDQRNARYLTRPIKKSLQEDRRRRAAEAGSGVKALLASNPPLICEAWIWMRGWYKDAVDHPPPPARVDVSTMTTEREEIYRHVPSPGEPIPVGDPLSVSWWMIPSRRMKRSPGWYAGFA